MSGIGGIASTLLGPIGTQHGWQDVVHGLTPGAGQPYAHVVPGQYRERLMAVKFTFATSAVVANRVAALQLSDASGNELVYQVCSGAIVAASVLTVTLAVGLTTSPGISAGNSVGGICDLIVEPGWTWSIVASAMDAGDQISAVTMIVQRFPTSDPDIATTTA